VSIAISGSWMRVGRSWEVVRCLVIFLKRQILLVLLSFCRVTYMCIPHGCPDIRCLNNFFTIRISHPFEIMIVAEECLENT
jgi:hypothetical protein